MQESAVRAALTRAARSVGLKIGPLDLLRVGNNYVYADRSRRLLYRVVVRDVDPSMLTTENTRIAELAKQGAPIVPPARTAPIRLDTGHLATVWPLGDPPGDNATIELAHVLAKLHTTPPLDDLPPWGGFARGWYRVGVANEAGITSELVNQLAERLSTLQAEFPPWGTDLVVHGDPHTGNLVQLDGHHALVDLDDLAVGCREIDLAPVCLSYRRFTTVPGTWSTYLDAYGHGDAVDLELLEWFVRLRQLTMVAWLMTLWDLRPESQPEIRHRLATLDTEATWSPL